MPENNKRKPSDKSPKKDTERKSLGFAQAVFWFGAIYLFPTTRDPDQHHHRLNPDPNARSVARLTSSATSGCEGDLLPIQPRARL